MKIYRSALFTQFRCIAGDCPDSCCKEWGVTVDDGAAALYRALPGALGDRLRQVLKDDNGVTVMEIIDGRCPMWRTDGLCRIQAELGHEALCKTCREFPRLTHDYGDFQEWGLELSCPEAARLILESPTLPPDVLETPQEGAAEYDEDVMALLRGSRPGACALLEQWPLPEGLALLLMYAYHIQAQIDGGEIVPFDAGAALAEARGFAGKGSMAEVLAFYGTLEVLSPQWPARLHRPAPSPWETRHRALARYFVERYWLQAVADYDLVSRAKLAVVSCLVIRALGGDLLQTAQAYSKEIENDPDNIDALLDGAYTCPAFTDEKLLGLLLKP
ncbi:MAG: hypothetical protein E7436_03680 [Ruminococcaceae bacterium]|nr:hypothetical protein [Oscillospiraceae bacterium]MBE6974572.1 hypothetical protein [Oscillospiraceae bacterium]